MLNERTYEASTYVAFSVAYRDPVDHNHCYRTKIHGLYLTGIECAMGRNKLHRYWVTVTMPIHAVPKSKEKKIE